MKEWMKNLWNQSGKWFLISLPLAALVIGAAVWQANQTYEASKHTIADPPAESQVTFDLDRTGSIPRKTGLWSSAHRQWKRMKALATATN